VSKEREQEAMELIDNFSEAFRTDDDSIVKKGRYLIAMYDSASDDHKYIIDDVLITLCGYSFETLMKGDI
jgi:hypothetical protein